MQRSSFQCSAEEVVTFCLEISLFIEKRSMKFLWRPSFFVVCACVIREIQIMNELLHLLNGTSFSAFLLNPAKKVKKHTSFQQLHPIPAKDYNHLSTPRQYAHQLEASCTTKGKLRPPTPSTPNASKRRRAIWFPLQE